MHVMYGEPTDQIECLQQEILIWIANIIMTKQTNIWLHGHDNYVTETHNNG